MRTKLFKTSIAAFFLLLFTSGNVFGFEMLLHDHDHQDQIEECLVCDKALLDQFSPLDITAEQPEISVIAQDHQSILDQYTSLFSTRELSAALFGRPPPALI